MRATKPSTLPGRVGCRLPAVVGKLGLVVPPVTYTSPLVGSIWSENAASAALPPR